MGTPEDLERRIESLERRVLRLEDTESIRRLKARYGELADARYGRDGPRDRRHLEGLARQLAALFTEDAVWDAGGALGRCEGREAIYERFCEPTLRASWHYFVKPQIAVEGDRAWGRWDVLAPCTLEDGRPHWMAGVEDDEYHRVGGEWLHASMKLEVVFFAPYDGGWKRMAIPER